MDTSHAVLRVFWPDHLHKELESAPQLHLLYGWCLSGSKTLNISSSTTTSYIVVGTVPANTHHTIVNTALYHLNEQAIGHGIQHQIQLLGSWTSQSAPSAACPDLAAYRNSLSSSQLIHLSAFTNAQRSGDQSTAACLRVPCIQSYPTLSPSQSNQVFLYSMPQPGVSHFPVPAAVSKQLPSAAWPWMGEHTRATPLEQAQQLMNYASWVQRTVSSACASGSGANAAVDRPTAAAAVTGWLAAKLSGPADAKSSSWLAATPTGAHLLRKVRGCISSTPAAAPQPHAQQYNREKLACERAISAEVLQHLLGLLLAVMLLYWQSSIYQLSLQLGHWAMHAVMEPNIAWLMTAKPGGIKLHAELTFLYGSSISSTLAAAGEMYKAAWQPAFLVLLYAMAGVSGVLGICSAAAMLGDALLLIAWPVELIYITMTKIYSLQLYYTGATWRLMRGDAGRKFWRRQVAVADSMPAQNSLWGNTDKGKTDEVTVEHIIVGVLLFTPLLALLPTTLAWYLLLVLLHSGVAAVRLVSYKWCQAILHNVPHIIACRLVAPRLFPASVLVQRLSREVSDGCVADMATSCAPGAASRAHVANRSGHVLAGVYQVLVQPVSLQLLGIECIGALANAKDRERLAGLLGAVVHGKRFGLLYEPGEVL